jgi:hypothetical protein
VAWNAGTFFLLTALYLSFSHKASQIKKFGKNKKLSRWIMKGTGKENFSGGKVCFVFRRLNFFFFWLSLEQVFSVEFKKESFERFIEF